MTKSKLVNPILCAFAVACIGATPKYEPGQVWQYKARPQDKGSTVTIIKIDKEGGRNTISIRIDGLKMKHAEAPGGFMTEIGHLPISEEKLSESTTKLVKTKARIPVASDEGYKTWKKARTEGHAGIFGAPLDKVVDSLEASFAKGAMHRVKG